MYLVIFTDVFLYAIFAFCGAVTNEFIRVISIKFNSIVLVVYSLSADNLNIKYY